MIGLADVDGRTAADIVHRRMSTLPASSTVGELRTYFGESSSRQLALLVDDGRYVGSVSAEDLPGDAEASAPALELVQAGPTIEASAPAEQARDAALESASARLPVVDEDGALVGVVAINHTRDGFCGT